MAASTSGKVAFGPRLNHTKRRTGTCPACAATYAESQRLMATLDRHWSEAGIERIRQRIETEERPVRRLRLFSPVVRRALAAAAVFLIAVGLIWLVPDWDKGRAIEPQFALLVQPQERGFKVDDAIAAKVRSNPQAPAIEKGMEVMALKARLERDGKLPPPTEVSVDLGLVNRGERPVELRLGDTEPMLTLDLEGPGVVRIPAKGAETPRFLRRQSVRIEPGERLNLHVDRLIAGSPDKLEYIYLTEPGDYTLTVLLHGTVEGREITVISEPARIKVEK